MLLDADGGIISKAFGFSLPRRSSGRHSARVCARVWQRRKLHLYFQLRGKRCLVRSPVSHQYKTVFSFYFQLFLQWRRMVDQAARPFAFIHYDPVIQRKQRDFREPSQQKSRLAEDLTEIQSIMRQNIDQILNRGEKLDNVSNISNELRSKSKDFKWGAQKVTWQVQMQQYGAMVVGIVLVLFVIYIRLFGFPFSG